jgi:hypothetical protein
MRRGVVKTLASTLWLALAIAPGKLLAEEPARPAAEETPSFTISADPTVAVLQLAFYGSSSGGRGAYTLYGDGRLVRTSQRLGQEAVDTEVRLSFQETMELMGIAVRHGLAETSRADLAARVREVTIERLEAHRQPGLPRPPIPPPPVDGGTARIEVRVESLGDGGPRENVLSGQGLLSPRPDPRLPELVGWKLLIREVSARFPRERR